MAALRCRDFDRPEEAWMATEHDRDAGGAGKTSSRRRLLTRGTGALAAVLAGEVLTRPAPAAADNGGNVILGQVNTETITTQISCTDGQTALWGSTVGSGTGLYGTTVDGTGVAGFATGNGFGVNGSSGIGGTGDGVLGLSRGTGNGVHGFTNASANAILGENDGTGNGVAGRAPGGVGILGDSANGVGVSAVSQNATALKVTGRAQFSRSGNATVEGTSATPKDSVRVHLPITAKSMLTALLQRRIPGVYVAAAVPNVAGGYFTLYLNKSVSTSAGPIAWIVTEMP
jgi:hypothetical protein